MVKVKLIDVANKAGVSLTTASFVLNGKGNISAKIRRKVLSTAEKMGYVKNPYAASMASSKTRHIAVLMDIDQEKAYEWDLFLRIFSSLEECIASKSCYPILVPIKLQEKAKEILNRILASGAGALVSIHYVNKELFRMAEDRGIPVVVVNDPSCQAEFCTVDTDNFQGAYEATRHLLQLGHTTVACVDYERSDHSIVSNDRFTGFKRAMEETGHPYSDNLRITVDLYDMDDIHQKIASMMKDLCPSAIFVHDDYLAALINVCLEKLTVSVPENLSMIAIGGNFDYSQAYIKPMSTFSINTEKTGQLAGDMILSRLQSKTPFHETIKTRQSFIDRGSCREYGR